MKKIIVMGVIALFVLVGFQPAFAVESKLFDDDTQVEESHVEFIVSIYGIGKTDEFKVLLTQEQADKLEMVLNELDFKIRNSESKRQTIDSIKWAFNSFQEFNLFNKQDEKIIKSLLTSMVSNSKVKHDTKPVKQENNENFNCTISGYFESSYIRFNDGEHPNVNRIIEFMYNNPIGWLLLPIVLPLLLIYDLIHRFYGKEYDGYVIVGYHLIQIYWYEENHYWYPTECDIQTNGTNGIVTWGGKQYGQIRKIKYIDDNVFPDDRWIYWYFVGIEGFTGAKFTYDDKTYILGNAQHVALDPERP